MIFKQFKLYSAGKLLSNQYRCRGTLAHVTGPCRNVSLLFIGVVRGAGTIALSGSCLYNVFYIPVYRHVGTTGS